MDSKVTIAIVAVVVAIVAIAGVAFFMMNNNDSGGGAPSDGILYDGNGGKLSGGETTYIQHTTSVDTCAFVRDGYHWVVWNTKADGSGTDYSENSVAPAKTTLYAQWSNANTIYGDNGGIEYVSTFIADSNGGKEVNIDTGYAELPSSAVFIVKPQSDVKLKVYVDGTSIVAEKAGKKVNIEYPTGTTGIKFENGRVRDDGAAVFDIEQTISNQRVMLGFFSVSLSDVLDIGGTRIVPTDIMDFTLVFNDIIGALVINNTGSVMVGEDPEIHIRAVKSGSEVSYDADSSTVTITVGGKDYGIQFKFQNGAELVDCEIEGNTAILKFSYESDKDPMFYRLISS